MMRGGSYTSMVCGGCLWLIIGMLDKLMDVGNMY